MSKKNKFDKTDGVNYGFGTHPGAYIDDYDIDNERLDAVNSADDIFTEKISEIGRTRRNRRPANPASPPASDPPVPNRAHTEM